MTRRQKLLRKLQDLQLLLMDDAHDISLSVGLANDIVYISLDISCDVKNYFIYNDTSDDDFSAIVNDFSNLIASHLAKNL